MNSYTKRLCEKSKPLGSLKAKKNSCALTADRPGTGMATLTDTQSTVGQTFLLRSTFTEATNIALKTEVTAGKLQESFCTQKSYLSSYVIFRKFTARHDKCFSSVTVTTVTF